MIPYGIALLVFPWAFSPRTSSVGKSGTHFRYGHRLEPVLGPAVGPVGRWDKIRRLASTVAVVEADDVVFPEVAPRLHLDRMGRDLTRVFQPMVGAAPY